MPAPAIGKEAVVRQILGVLSEAFNGPPEHWSYFTDTAADAGLFGTLAKIAASDACRVLGRTTIAAHVNHILFSMHASSRWIEGDRTTHSWDESWSVSRVDEASWDLLRDRLKVAYIDVRRAIELFAFASEEAMGGVMGALAHLAYHLGAIRQKVSIIASSLPEGSAGIDTHK